MHIDDTTIFFNFEDLIESDINVSSFNFLGMTLDENLSFTKHIDLIKIRVSKTIGVPHRLKRIFPENL